MSDFAHINYNNLNIYITSSPNEYSLDCFIDKIKTYNINHVIRVCSPMYDKNKLIKKNINFYDMEFEDGTIPSHIIIKNWLEIIRFHHNEPILIHCIAGLGRAPLLVTILLIEQGMNNLEAIEYIRKVRPGALNSKQIGWLIKYKPNIRYSWFKKIFKL